MCQNRSRHYGKKMTHLFTSHKRTSIDGVWGPWASYCCWCGKPEIPNKETNP